MKLKKTIIMIMIFIILLLLFPMIIQSTLKNSLSVNHNTEILENVKIIQNYAEEYIKQKGITTYTATELCMQYMRKDRYNTTLWNMLLGDIDSGFITFLNGKENVPNFKNQMLLDPNTGKNVDLVHMIAPLNAYIKNGENVMGVISTHYSGWAGDLITLLEEITVYRTQNNIQDSKQLQEYCNSLLGTNNASTSPSSDMLANLDAFALYKDSSNGIKSNLYNALYKYYVSTDSNYNASNRLETSQKILGGSKSAIKTTTKKLLTNTDFFVIDVKESFFADKSVAAKVSSTDIEVVSESFANYVYGEPYLKLKENSGTVTVGNVKDIKIIERNVNLRNVIIENENNEIVKTEIYKDYLRITPLEAGKTNITVYSEDKSVSTTFELNSKNIAPSITENLEETYELTVGEEKTLSIKAEGTNNIYTWYIQKEAEEVFSKINEENSNTYKLIPTLEMNNSYIKCGVRNKENDEIFSTTAKLVVKENCEHEFTINNDDKEHWEQCGLCGEVKAETRQEHSGATHPEGKCSICEFVYESHKLVVDSEEYEKIDNQTHKIISKCSFTGCETNFEEIKEHEGAEHSNGGICVKCKYQYDAHIISTERADWEITETTHAPIYKCINLSCSETQIGEAEGHSGATHPEGKCSICEFEYESHKSVEDNVEYEKIDNQTHKIISKCSFLGCEINYEEIKEHEGAEHSNEGICVKCKYQYDAHIISTERSDWEITETTHAPIYKCINTSCSEIQIGEAEGHSGATHPEGKCVICAKQYQTHAISKEVVDYTITLATHTPIYKCLDNNCTATEAGKEENHIYKDGKCEKCEANEPIQQCEHQYESRNDDSNHWKQCAKCEEIEEKSTENHIYKYTDNKDETHTGTCSICNHNIKSEHEYETKQDDNNKWNECELCGVKKVISQNGGGKDPTEADKEIPKAGVEGRIDIMIYIVAIFSIIIFIKMKKQNTY